MDIGSQLEGMLMDKFAKTNGVTVIPSETTFYHPVHGFLIANVDGLIPSSEPRIIDGYPDYEMSVLSILEIKTAKKKTEEWGGHGTNQIPIQYLCQIAHYCMVTEVEKAYLSVLFKQEEEIVDYVYNRDLDFENKIKEKLIHFWNEYVLKNKYPPIKTYSDIGHLYKDLGDIKVSLETLTKIDRYKSLSNQVKLITSERDQVKEEIAIEIGGYGYLIGLDGDRLGSFKCQSHNRLSSELVKKNYSDVYEDCLVENSFQVLRIK